MRKQRDAFTGPDPSREEYLRQMFSRRWVFAHYGSEFHFIPDEADAPPDALLGRIGREVASDENLPPQEGLAETTHTGWKACVLVLDPRDHEDGQKIALQVDRRVGSPLALVAALTNHINEANPLATYAIELQPIFDPASFWQFARRSKSITSITFDFVAPNGLFGTRNLVREELAAMRDTSRAREVAATFRNPDGLDINSEPVRDAIDYAESSGGKIRAKNSQGERFNSTEQPRFTTLSDENGENEPLIVRAARHVARIFGRD